MNSLSSCFKWEKNYLYFNSTGKLTSRSLNFFQRGLRVLGFYADTRLSSIAKACLLSRHWNEEEGKNIATLLTKVQKLPLVKWTEQNGNNKINIECEITTNGFKFYFYDDTLLKRTLDVWDVNTGYSRKNDLPTIVSSIGRPDSSVRKLAFQLFTKMTANSLAVQIPRAFWYSGVRKNVFVEEAKQYNLIPEGDEANIDTMFVSGHLFLTHEKAVDQSNAYPLKTPYSFDFFTVLKDRGN
jgi:hypothetical protein